MAAAGNDGTVTLWSLGSGDRLSLRADEDSLPVYAVVFSPDAGLLATGHGDGTVKLWKMGVTPFSIPQSSRRPLSTQTAPHPARVLAFSPNSETLAIGVDVNVLLCDNVKDLFTENREGTKCRTAEAEQGGRVRALTFSRGTGEKVLTGGDELLVGADDASVRLLDAKTRALRSIYTGPTGHVLDVAFSPDGQTIAAAGADKTVGLWQAQAGPEGGTSGGSPSRPTENPDDVIGWVCGYRPKPVLPRWPESISTEFRRDIC